MSFHDATHDEIAEERAMRREADLWDHLDRFDGDDESEAPAFPRRLPGPGTGRPDGDNDAF